jgi:RNA polymerase sigma factor (sigma-70 family)
MGASFTREDPIVVAFDGLFEQCYEPMVRLSTAIVDRQSVAEEIVQEAFRRLWERLPTIERPPAYLRIAVVNGSMAELRRRRVRRKHSWRERPESVVDEHHYLLDALATVPLRRRTALVLRFYGGLQLAEIAEAMGVRPGTAKSLISRGLDDLRKVIE